MVELFQNIRPWFTEFLNLRNFRHNTKLERLYENLIYFQDNYILIGFLALTIYCFNTAQLLGFVFLILFMASVKLTQITGRTRRASPESIWLAILLLLINAGAAFYWLPEVSLLITFTILLHASFYFNKHQSKGPRSHAKIRNSFWNKLTDVAFGMVLLVFIYIKLGSNSEITQEFVNGPSEEI